WSPPANSFGTGITEFCAQECPDCLRVKPSMPTSAQQESNWAGGRVRRARITSKYAIEKPLRFEAKGDRRQLKKSAGKEICSHDQRGNHPRQHGVFVP